MFVGTRLIGIMESEYARRGLRSLSHSPVCAAPEWKVNRRQNRHHSDHLSSQRFVIIETRPHNLKSKININVNGFQRSTRICVHNLSLKLVFFVNHSSLELNNATNRYAYYWPGYNWTKETKRSVAPNDSTEIRKNLAVASMKLCEIAEMGIFVWNWCS